MGISLPGITPTSPSPHALPLLAPGPYTSWFGNVNRIPSRGMVHVGRGNCSLIKIKNLFFCVCVCIVYCLEAEIDYDSNQRSQGWHCGLVLFWSIIVVLMLNN